MTVSQGGRQVDLIIEQLKAGGCNPRRSGKGWKAKCPAHDDHDPSLSIDRTDDGNLLLYCHAGCQFDEIVKALGFDGKESMHDRPKRSSSPSGQIVDKHGYEDKHGRLLYQTVRYEPKDFKQRRPDGNGNWIWDLKGVRRVLYRLPELLEDIGMDRRIYVVEGEKDVDRLRSERLASTCNVGGAGRWRKEYSEILRGAKVCILPDNDDSGRKHATKVAHSLYGVAAEIKIVELSGLSKKGDVSDWLMNGGTTEELEKLADEATPWEPEAAQAAANGLNDLFHAQRVVEFYGEDIRYCRKLGGFLIWDGKQWAYDETGETWRFAVKAAKRVYEESVRIQNIKERDALREWAARAERRSNIENALKQLQHQESIAIKHDVFDTNPWLLNCANGTLDLRTGELAPHRREAMITKLAPVEYDPTAECPTWERFLDVVMAGNQDLIAYLQLLAGYCLTGDTREQKLFFLYGTGQNGKSTFLDTLQHIWGDYARPIASDLLLTRREDSHPTGMADLQGTRLAVSTEVEQGKRMAEVRVKDLTGYTSGNSVVKARRMRQDYFEFKATHKLIMAGNHKPVVQGTDDGIWRRIHLVPFTVKIQHPDNTLPGRLLDEASGILSWCVRGCLEWQASGLSEPDEVVEATKVYRSEMDILGDYLGERCTVLSDAQVSSADLYADYRDWCQGNKESDIGRRKFGMAIRERGFTQVVRGKRIWLGIGLVTARVDCMN